MLWYLYTMNIGALKLAIAHLDDRTEIVINGRTVDGFEVIKGRLSADTFGGQTFTKVAEHKAKDEVGVFTVLTEYADGFYYPVVQ